MLRFCVAAALSCAWIVACAADVDEPYYMPPTTTGPGSTGPGTPTGDGPTGTGNTNSDGDADAGDGADMGDGADTSDGDDADTGTTDTGSTSDTGDSTTTTTSTGGTGSCGDGMVGMSEQCDGGDLKGFDCTSLGYTGGTLACDPVMCTFDTSMCSNDDGGTSGG